PQNDDGTYTGFHPKDSAAALQELQRSRARGAEFLLFPATAFWWLEHYKDFAAQLAADCRVVVRDEKTCILFALQEKPAPVAPSYHPLARQVRRVVESLLPPNAVVLVASTGDPALLELGSRTASHFPQDADGGYEGTGPLNSEAGIAH